MSLLEINPGLGLFVFLEEILGNMTMHSIPIPVAFPALIAQAIPAEPVIPPAQMTLFEAVVIGLVQGLTEFLPISSTGHIKAVPVALGWGDPGLAFTAIIQLGSIAAILSYFWQDLVQVTQGTLRAVAKADYQSPDFRLGAGIVLGTVPLVFFGVLVKLFVPGYESGFIRSMAAIGISSIIMSIALAFAEAVGRRKRGFEKLTMWDGIWMGIGQALAIVPGVSRSGATLTAGLFMEMKRETAARFSFLMGIPAIVLAGLAEVKDFVDAGFGNVGLVPLIAGLLAATVSSYLAIAWLLHFLQRHSTWVFVWYRLAFGIIILAAIASGAMENI